MAEKNELSQKKFMIDYHEAFFKLLHIPLDWLSVERQNFTICGKDHCNPLCARIMETRQGAKLCEEGEREMLGDAIRTRRPVVKKCHAGFYDMLIPLFAGEQYIGSLCIGQYIHRMPDARQQAKILSTLSFLKLTPGELKQYFREATKLSVEEEGGLEVMVQLVGDHIVETYNRIQFLEAANDSEPIQLAEKYIRQHYAQPLTIPGIARAVGMSRSYFIRRFTEQIGCSPMAYLTRYRVQQAMEFLKDSKLAVFEVADACGFGNVYAINRSFHKYAGCSPAEYRQKLKNESPEQC